MRLKDSLDQIFAEPLEGVIDCVESKVFGIGVEWLDQVREYEKNVLLKRI